MSHKKLDAHFLFTIGNFCLGLFMHYRVSQLESARERMLGRRMMIVWTTGAIIFVLTVLGGIIGIIKYII